MWLKLSTLALLPVLFIQGTKVRKNTPHLMEASGEREGLIGQGKPLSLLILGDSAAPGMIARSGSGSEFISEIERGLS